MISVIIPIYNVEAYIEDCLKSVASQTCLKQGVQVECILVDDCGTDNSISIAEAIINRINENEDKNENLTFKLLHHNHNRGLSAARNTGMEVAQGEYVFFLDSDDKITPDCLEKLYAKALDTDADVTFGSYKTFGCENKQYITNGAPYVTAWNKLCKRTFLQSNNIQFIEGLIHEDCPWSFEIECKGAKFAHVPDITYLYLVREGSLQTGKDFNKHFEAYMLILQEYARIITSSGQKAKHLYWFELQKALLFSMTLSSGTPEMCKQMYLLIRRLEPKPLFSKADSHYYLPSRLGFVLYKKFHKYYMCF